MASPVGFSTSEFLHLGTGHSIKCGVYLNLITDDLVIVTKDTFETSEYVKHFGSIIELSDYLNALAAMILWYEYLGEL